ncbi:MAG: bacillithiol system redox-active protein YtxJ [Candidatus Latescibacterota bacterium]|jgi:bacillithiol system protein YtxJ
MAVIKEIISKNDLDEIFQDEKALVFKNSLYCGISQNALRELKKFVETIKDDVKVYIIDVNKNRDLSQMIAEKSKIKHESPQILLLEKGVVTWNASHWNITFETCRKATES